ncbi:hypothetical protein GMDG_05616 [Pseudogymnoascus destructans 20631-21]|uniref:BCD1 alpha/beta domain-containing protein n=1 Tax=Pseudogymnoascus destructans (strain ATCC MYA-4855 / 20631-21) TaxID=658429 RepID=L8FP50_PSED2|nr:hypothetical protein GMDG_05616 [Pseudogymnoascus destructans 20631-21]
MGRRKANGTSWSRKRGCLVWQVEWVAPGTSSNSSTTSGTSTTSTTGTSTASAATTPTVPGMLGPLSKILATTPLEEAYTAFLEETRRAALTPEEKAGEKRRRAVEVAESAGGGRGEASMAEGQPLPDTTTDTTAEDEKATPTHAQPQPPQTQTKSAYTFYLHRPLTLSSGPTVLIPLRGDEGLDTQLLGKLILEFPRLYVFPAGSAVPGGLRLRVVRRGVGEKMGRKGRGEVRRRREGRRRW